ncbi:MAG: hypothetical protein K2N75_00355 [Helicobacter sp.]|uniref:hypothetical protein n=1 Tax=Helicobacter sp. TaxID=218 RepID=UPI0023D585B7|nr:hypothetical protein [Helicobacter sp.]MDE7174495.1 hypothetical protein [Helicobacter sp.]
MTINSANTNYLPSMQNTQKEQKENANNPQELQPNNALNNVSNNAQNDKSNNSQNTTKEMSDFQTDIFESVKKAFGFGADSEGFFTSDLNEAAGIPEGIKIHAILGVEYYLSSVIWSYNNIDLVGSVKNFYQEFSKLSEQEKDNIVNKTKEIKYFLENGTQYSLYDTLLKRFTNVEGGLNESGKLEAFIRMNPDLMVAEKTINLAIQGNGAYASFIDKNDNLLGMNILDKGKAGQLLRTSINEMSAEEFGKQWGELREEYRARYDAQQERFRKENEEIEEYNKNLAEQKTQKKSKAIQVNKKSETYQDLDFLNTLEFIKSQQKLEQILMLFQRESKGNFDIQNFKDFLASSWKRLDREV